MKRKIKSTESGSLEVQEGLDGGLLPDVQTDKKLRAMDKAGVTQALRFTRLFEGLNATRKVKTVDDSGELVEAEEADLLIRHKYLETAFKVANELKEGVSVGVGVAVNNVSKEERELLEAYKRK